MPTSDANVMGDDPIDRRSSANESASIAGDESTLDPTTADGTSPDVPASRHAGEDLPPPVALVASPPAADGTPPHDGSDPKRDPIGADASPPPASGSGDGAPSTPEVVVPDPIEITAREKGYYKLWTADASGAPLDFDSDEFPDPTDDRAVEIYMGVNLMGPETAPTDQAMLVEGMGKVLRTLQLLYRPSDSQTGAEEKKAFRIYYVRLLCLGQLGLDGKDVATPVASDALRRLIADLVDDHAGRIKNAHLRKLGKVASVFGGCFLMAFLVLRLLPSGWNEFFNQLGIDRKVFSNFMILWMGCSLGVWLSYGVRKASFTLRDLTVSDEDRLTPFIRLLFAGFTTMVIGLLFVLELVEVKLGAYPITAIASNAALAFVIGVFCGLSELLLPNMLGKRASDFIGKIV